VALGIDSLEMEGELYSIVGVHAAAVAAIFTVVLSLHTELYFDVLYLLENIDSYNV